MGQHLHPFMPSQPVVGYRCTQPKQQRAVSWAWVMEQHTAADSVVRVATLWHTQEPEQSPGLQLMTGRLTHPPDTPPSPAAAPHPPLTAAPLAPPLCIPSCIGPGDVAAGVDDGGHQVTKGLCGACGQPRISTKSSPSTGAVFSCAEVSRVMRGHMACEV
jgi:hypothetical protein